MNVKNGLSRLITVIWVVFSFLGFFFIYLSVEQLLLGYEKSGQLVFGIGIVIACYIGWMVSQWILKGFFSN